MPYMPAHRFSWVPGPPMTHWEIPMFRVCQGKGTHFQASIRHMWEELYGHKHTYHPPAVLLALPPYICKVILRTQRTSTLSPHSQNFPLQYCLQAICRWQSDAQPDQGRIFHGWADKRPAKHLWRFRLPFPGHPLVHILYLLFFWRRSNAVAQKLF